MCVLYGNGAWHNFRKQHNSMKTDTQINNVYIWVWIQFKTSFSLNLNEGFKDLVFPNHLIDH